MQRSAEKSRRAAVLLLWLAAGWARAGGTAAPVPPPTAQDLDLLRRATALAPYAGSLEAKQNPGSLGFFFPRSLYPKLLGNPIMGYLYDEGYAGAGPRIRLKRFRYPARVAPHAAAFRHCVQTAFGKAGLQLGDTGETELGVALLGVVAVKTGKSLPGLAVEFYLRNRATGKTLFVRRSFGHQESLVKAMMDAAVYMAVRAGQ